VAKAVMISSVPPLMVKTAANPGGLPFTEDLKKITVPVLVMHGDDDQLVPYADSGPLSAKLLTHGTLKTYKGFPHGMPTTEAETISADLLAFVKA
jgi:non-heme chloroperoxidase